MDKNLNLSSILFLDIETVPQYPSFEDCPDELKALWARKAEKLSPATKPAATEPLLPTADQPTANSTPLLPTADCPTANSLYHRAGIYAEFGKIICISTGFLHYEGKELKLRLKSFYGHDERLILEEFAALLNRSFARNDSRLCAHNGKEFDFPWLARRMLVNGIKIPFILDTSGKKPWEVNHLDTMDMWRFGDYKSYTPLNLLTYLFGIPTPKDDIDGSQVWHIYHHDHDLPRIVKYCEKDVEALVRVYLRMSGNEDPISINFVEKS